MAEALVAAASSNYHPRNPTSKPPIGLSKDKYVNQVKKQKNVASYHKDDGLFGDKLTVEKSSVEKSLSWGNLTQLSLTDHHRSLSASNIYALHDPDLSIKAAISKKAYDRPHTSFSKEKAKFTAWTQKYYHQLTVGCGNRRCKNIFCKSSSKMKKFDQRMISLISIELSGYKNQYLCIKDKKRQEAKVLDVDCFNISTPTEKDEQVPFLYRFYSMSPFRSLFLPCPLTHSGLGLHKTHSQGELNTPKKAKPIVNKQESNLTDTFKSHLTSFTTSISSSVSNIFHYASNSDINTQNVENSKITNDEGSILDEKECDETSSSPKCGDQFLTRRRIPSVRIFGDEYAVDRDTTLHDNIDEFEKSVAEEFKKEASENEFEDSLLSEEDVTIFHDDDEEEGDSEEPDGYSLTHLTLEMFQKILNNYQECSDESFLLNTIRTVFASWDALMLSFLDEGISKNKKHPFSVKIDDVHDVFLLLEQFDKHDKFRTVLTDTLQVMLLKKQSIKEPRELKPIVVILLMPYLFNHIDVVLEVSSMISRLSLEHLSVLSSFIADCFQEDKFVYLIEGIKSLIETESTRNSAILRNNERVVFLCKTMHLLYTANIVNGDHQTVVSNALFYCEELTSKVDFKQVYAYWKRRNFSTTNSILNYPFLLEPAVKVNVIHIDAITQMREEYQDAIVHQARMNQVQKSWSDFNDASKRSHEVRSAMCPYLLLEIRRENLINDTLKQLQEKNSDLKKPLKIKYTAGGEQGLDMGGLQKEFFQVIVETVFDTNYGLFNESEDGNVVWFNAYSFEATVMFELVGILLGLAIYNGIILDVHFPLLVYKKLLGSKVALQDLHDIQPTLAKSLEQLLNYSGDVADDFCQTFEVSHSVYGKPTNVELVANGHDVLVTNENRQQFVELYVDNILNKSIEKQFEAFKNGFFQVCNGPITKLFTPPELELLVCGNPNLDFLALEEATEYRDGYSKAHALMISFWKIVHKFTFKQKQALLMFVTGSYRVPLKGLGAMSFYIQRNGPDSNNLPTSMTCFNRLLLPEYITAQKLEDMLLLAIENSKGFGLT